MNGNNTTHRVQPQPVPAQKPKPLLRTHRRAFLLLCLYIPLVLIPWILTMVLVYRPLTRWSWSYAPGFWLNDYRIMRGWATAIPIMNAFAAVVAITVTSAVIAQAAVVFAQKRNSRQQLSVKELFSLADRVWCDAGALPGTLWRIWHGKVSMNWFLLGAAALVFLGAAQYPLIQILVSWKEIDVPHCQSTGYIREASYGRRGCDVPYKRIGNHYTQLGKDLEPAQLAVVPMFYIIPRIKTELSRYRPATKLQYLWQENDEYGFRHVADMNNIDKPGFVASLPADSTTGVLREHIMRMHSNISCTNVTVSAFPTTCLGTDPFQTSLIYENSGTSYNGTMDICAPGDRGKHPWTLSRNRQDITEEVFLKYKETYVSRHLSVDDAEVEKVFHCTAQTTRGYFELGNAHNGGQFGPLLDKWPSTRSSSGQYMYNDYFEAESGYYNGYTAAYFPSEEDRGRGDANPIPDPASDYNADLYEWKPEVYTNVTGPLMTSILALFGPESWTYAATNMTIDKTEDELLVSHTDQRVLLDPLCDLTPYALSKTFVYSRYDKYTCTRSLSGLRRTLDDFLTDWTKKTNVEDRLRAAIFFSNQALLNSHREGYLPWDHWTGREIYTAEGWTVRKPVISLPAQIILSLVVGCHVLGLLALAFFIHRWPAWTRTLDAMAIARVAVSLDPSLLPPIRSTKRTDVEPLADVNGLVGVHENETSTPRRSTEGGNFEHGTDNEIEMRALSVASTVGKEPTSSATPAYDTSMTLELGAPGLVPRRKQLKASPPVANDEQV